MQGHPWWFFSMARFSPGGFTYYGEDVRMPADRYLTRTVMGIIAAALTMLVILIIVLPIIKQRIHSFLTAVNCIGTGAAIALCLVSPSWLRGYAVIESPLDYLKPNEIVKMKVGLHIGLSYANITLENVEIDPLLDNSTTLDFNPEFFYNEKLLMFTPDAIEPNLKRALRVGLPVPLLTVIDFMASATMKFRDSQDIMEAGYHCYLSLMLALLVWILALLFTAAVPRYSCYAFMITGALMIATNIMYFFWTEIDHTFPAIYLSGKFIQLRYGVCFWICLGVGIWSYLFGYSLAVYDLTHPDKFLTIFDLDYDKKRNIIATKNRAKSSHGNNEPMEDETAEYVHPNVWNMVPPP